MYTVCWKCTISIRINYKYVCVCVCSCAPVGTNIIYSSPLVRLPLNWRTEWRSFGVDDNTIIIIYKSCTNNNNSTYYIIICGYVYIRIILNYNNIFLLFEKHNEMPDLYIYQDNCLVWKTYAAYSSCRIYWHSASIEYIMQIT